jgi:hypothetical protein
MDSLTRALQVLSLVIRQESPVPPYLRMLRGLAHVRAGGTAEEAQAQFALRPPMLSALLDAPDPFQTMFGCPWDLPADDEKIFKAAKSAQKNIGQLLLGGIAERVFEHIYKTQIGTDDLRLEDDRAGRNDTDYRVLNGHGRRVFRINIKFHGSEFRRAQELVGLDPSDCFALATYKIAQGLKKETAETLPYLFVIVSALGLSGESVGEVLPPDISRLVTLVRLGRKVPGLKKRDIEDGVVSYLLGRDAPEEFVRHRDRFTHRLENVEWRVLSATKADKMLRTLLFERVYAVRVPRFAQNYRNAELDMHFSLSQDLTPLTEFLQIYKDEGLPMLTAHLSRGKI